MEKKKSKIKKAVALSYKETDTAPRVTAMGKGVIAEKIIEAAKRHNVPVFYDEKLVDDLLKIEIGKQIPPELYLVVAEVLSFISYIDKQKENKNEGQ
ncbi:MAG TPA: hypothetical protein GX498_01675 [Clostridiales bacterium]|nr:hypothetical protein [Clostridiales bacterium]